VPLNGRLCITTGCDEPPADDVTELVAEEVVQ
jgi:hypothetical protein